MTKKWVIKYQRPGGFETDLVRFVKQVKHYEGILFNFLYFLQQSS